ncbi:HD-GYP domain-containing protein [uncultured Metabacillus sp.]|uniref:HD-GYP domain-containing protein n=1 Tax=uncultured Metabacillus sp. TaxID=2860135 RepID=UPI00262ED931|nr:HD-GYP domain-containing protein [uncultured Metabacillus sp.]
MFTKQLENKVNKFMRILDARDPYTAGHSERVAKYSIWIAKKLSLDDNACSELYKAALLHDIGKIGIPDQILLKPDRLTEEEFEIIKQHPRIGASILSNMEPKASMVYAIQTVRSHHERMNGTGYPDQLKGDDIPLFARIVAVTDSFDAMTTPRSYSTQLSYREAAAELIRCKHTLFDAKIVDSFTEILEKCDYQIVNYEIEFGEGLL